MGRIMFNENDKWRSRNYAGRRMFDEFGQSRRVVVPGEVIVLDRSRSRDGELPDLEIHRDPNTAPKGLGLDWLKPKQFKSALLWFAFGVWSVWSALIISKLAI